MAVTKNLVNIGDASISGNLTAANLYTSAVYTSAVEAEEYTIRIGENPGITMDNDSYTMDIQIDDMDARIYLDGDGSGDLGYTGVGIWGSEGIELNCPHVDVSGKVNASQGFFQTSDINKKNVVGELDLDKAYELIDKCQTILYTLKDDESNKQEIGLIAQEVKEFFPELVTEDKEGSLSLDYSRLTVIILRVLKDVIDRVKKIESK